MTTSITGFPIEALPFVRYHPGEDRPRTFWTVPATQDYAKQCQIGALYGVLAYHYIAETGFTPLLGWIVRDMILTQTENGYAVGFCSEIASRLR